MKLTTLLLMVAIVQVSASSFGQRVTLSEKKAPIQKVFDKISLQTGFDFLFSDEILKEISPISISVKNEALKTVLNRLFEGQPLEYSIEDKSVVISRKRVSILTNLKALFNLPITVSGRIIDTTGSPLAGATVRIKSANTTVLTNKNGEFSIRGKADDKLVISFTGYITQTIAVTENMPFQNIVMRMALSELNEVVISTGYQNISPERVTGSFSSVQTKRLEGKLQPGLLTALEGQAAGLVVTKDGKVEIRGKSTFLANAEPLIVVDGFPISGGLETVNIDNVESITVLKDAVAASIYGARSSNGVIVITTKTGKKDQLQVSYKGSAGVTLRPDLSYLDRASSADYVDAQIETYNMNPAYAQYYYDFSATVPRVNQLLIAKDRGQITAAQMNAELDQLKKNDGASQLQKYLFRPKFTQQHNLSLSSGSDKSMTSAAVRYISNQNSMILDKDDRLIFDLKNDWKPISKVTVRLFSNINFSNSTAPARSANEFTDYTPDNTMIMPYSLIVDPATGKPQDIPAVRDPITQFAGVKGLKPMNYNPLEDLALETTKGQNFQARLGASLNVNILEGLSAEVGGVWTKGSATSRTVYDVNSYRVRALYNLTTSIADNTKHYVPDGSIIDETRNNNEAYTVRGQLNFNRTFNSKHRITVIAGSEINKDVLDNNAYPTRYGYNDQAGTFSPFNYADFNAFLNYSDYLLPGGGLFMANNGGYTLRDNRFVSLYSNGSYEYDNRFILSGSARIDQTNFFGTNPKYRYKPNWSVGGTYKLANESFFQVPWISKLNIRGSYGINGNISLKQGPYLLIASQGFSNTTGGISYSIASPPNKDLRWERTQILNVGTDISLFNGRLNGTVDYYSKLSKDLLAPDFIDPTYGRSSITRNAGSARNTGIELSLESDVIRNSQFKWNVYFNGSYNKSKVLDFNFNYLYTSYLTSNSSARLFGGTGNAVLKTGYPLDALFSYEFAGLDNTGTATFYSADKSRILGGAATVQDLKYSGTIRPKYVLNLTNTFSYKRFDLSFMVISQLGSVFRNDTFNGFNYENKYVGQRWRVPGDEAKTIYPALTNSTTATWYYPYSDVAIESGNYMKLRDLTLAYTINNKVWGKSGLNNVKVYFQGRNLLMITANDKHIDPETAINADGNVSRSLPLRPEFYAGLSLNF